MASTADEREAASVSNRSRIVSAISDILAPLSFLILLGIILRYKAPNFTTPDNLKQIAVQAAVVAILACGQTAVIISGNIDLSVGAVMAFSGVVAGLAMTHHGASVPVGVLVAIGAGLGAGLLTGIIAAFGDIPSFIVTLGMMGIVYGYAGYISGSQNIGVPQGFNVFGVKELFGDTAHNGIPYAIVLMAIVAVLVHVLLSRTTWGRALYAMGGNRLAARLSGINLKKQTITVFALSGLLAGVAAVIDVSRSSVASYTSGNSYELYAVAATVIGGTSLFGGQGGVAGTIIGALLMFEIRNGCNLLGQSSEVERMITGAVVIIAVLYDRFGPARKRATAK